MGFNFSNIIAEETKRAEEGSGGQGNGYSTVYPFNPGKIEFRPIGNEVSGLLYRELFRHEFMSNGRKQKVPCLNRNYGADCPVCNMVQKVQDTFNDKFVFGKYGVKRRGVLYAKLVNIEPSNYFAETQNAPKIGDIFMLMLPKSAMDELSKLNREFSDSIEELYTFNTSRVMSLTISIGNNGFKNYNFYVKNYNHTICESGPNTPDDARFAELMKSLPDLREYAYSAKGPSDNDVTTLNVIVEQMNREYFAGGIQQPQVTQMGTQPYTTPAYNQAPQYTQPVGSPTTQQGMNTVPGNYSNNAGAQNATMPNVTQPATPVNNVPPVTHEPVQPQPSVTQPVSTPVPVQESTTTMPGNEPERPECFGNNQYNATCAACPWESECV